MFLLVTIHLGRRTPNASLMMMMINDDDDDGNDDDGEDENMEQG